MRNRQEHKESDIHNEKSFQKENFHEKVNLQENSLPEERTAFRGIKDNMQKPEGVRYVAAAVFAFAGGWAMPWMLHRTESLGYTNSVVSVFGFLVLFYLTDKALGAGAEGKWSGWIWPGCFGTAFSLCMVFGTQLDLQGSVPFTNIRMWGSILILAVLFALWARYFWDKFGTVKDGTACLCKGTSRPTGRENKGSEREKADEKEKAEKGAGRKKGVCSFIVRAGGIFLCYLPVFLAAYPGFFVYDAQDELLQVVTRNFSTHHPLLHVLFLGGVIQLVHKLTGSYNLGIACYTLIQMVVMAGIFAWCIGRLEKRGVPKWVRVLLVLYFGLFPVLVMFSLCSAKDGLFTGMLLIMVVLLQELCGDVDKFLEKKGSVALFGASSVGMMLLRHNGFYGFLVFIPILVFYLRKKWKKVLPYMIAIVVVYLVMNAGLAGALHANDSENQEMLTVPISQLARVCAYEETSLQDQEILYKYLPEEAVNRYTPKVTDGVKISFNNEAYAADPKSFWQLWAKWGLEHPFAYLNAWFMTSYGYWYPDTVIDTYRGNTVFTYTYEDSSYFGYEVEEPGTRESKIPWLDDLYRKMSLEITQQKIPVISMLFAPGFLFWVWAFILGYLCYGKKWRVLLPFILPGLCWLTVILGPACLVRYVVFLWALLPVLLCTCWQVIYKR